MGAGRAPELRPGPGGGVPGLGPGQPPLQPPAERPGPGGEAEGGALCGSVSGEPWLSQSIEFSPYDMVCLLKVIHVCVRACTTHACEHTWTHNTVSVRTHVYTQEHASVCTDTFPLVYPCAHMSQMPVCTRTHRGMQTCVHTPCAHTAMHTHMRSPATTIDLGPGRAGGL